LLFEVVRVVNPDFNQTDSSKSIENIDKIKVLHIDDEEDFLFLTKEFLEKMSEGEIIVEPLQDSTKVLERIKGGGIDVIVCDYLMEELNGLALLEKIKQEEYNIPFIIFTGRGREEVVIEALNLGADYYLRKGSDARSQYTELVHQIKTALRHKGAEKALKESEMRYRNLVEAFSDIIYITDLESRMIYANPALKEQTGFTLSDFQFSQEENPFIHPDDAERVGLFLTDFVKSDKKKSDVIENRFIDKIGITHWYSSVVTKIDFFGNPSLQFITHDITERKNLEEKIRQDRDLTKLYLAEAGVMFCIIDEDEKTELINKKLTEILGFTEDDIIGKNWFDTVYEERYRNEFKLHFQRVIVGNTEPSEYVEIEMTTKRGEKKVIAWRNTSIKDKNGKTSKLLGSGTDITERKRIEQQLQESEERYRGLVETSPNSIVLSDMRGNIIFANEYAATMYGVESTEELIGTTLLDFTAQEDHQRILANMRGMRNLEQSSYEYTMLRKDGSHFPVELNASILKDQQGIPFAIMGVGRDITERKQAERTLKESEAKYRGFIENFHGIAFRGTIDFQAVYFHGAIEEITGYTEEDFTEKGMKWDEIIHPDDISIPLSIRDNLTNIPNYKSSIEYRIIRKDEGIRWIRQFVQNLSEEMESPWLVQGTLYDITENKLTQIVIKESEERFRLLFNSTNDAIYLYEISEEGVASNFLEVNDIASQMLGYSKEDFMNMSPKDIAAAGTLERISEIIKEVMNKKKLTFEATHKTKEGIEIPVEISAHIFNFRGKQVMLSVVRNVAERKEAEEILKQSENLYRTTFESTGTGNLIVRKDKTIVLVNSKLEELTGYKKDEMIDKMKWSNFLKEKEWKRLEKYQELHFQDSKLAPDQYEIEYLTKDNQEKQGVLTVKAIPGSTDFIVTLLDISERIKTEQELKKSETLYRTIFKSTGTANVIISADSTILHVNEEIIELSSYSKEELEGQRWAEFILEEDLPRLKEFQRLRIEEPMKAIPQYETRFKDKQGKIIDILVNVREIPGTTDAIVVVVDISEIKREEEELKISENLYRTIFETTGAGKAILDEDTNVKLINTRLEEMSGYTKEEVEGKMSWLTFVHEDELERLRQFNEMRIKNPDTAPSSYETKLLKKDGEVRDNLIHVSVIPGTKDIVISMMDITDMKRIQDELEHSEDLYKTIFETTGSSYVIFDKEATIVMINSEMERLSGYSKEEIEGKKKWIEFIPEPELTMMIEYNKKRVTDPTTVPSQYETRFIDKYGNVKHILLNVNFIPTTGNFIVALMDITESKKTLEKLDKQREELSDFAHYMSHDIRNSLSAIEGYIDVFKVDEDQTYIDKILRRTKYIGDLLEHSVELAEAGLAIEEKNTVDLNHLVNTVADVVIPEQIKFKKETLSEIQGDKERLSQVFKNLFENAVIHGDPKEIIVQQEESANELVISVINDGKIISQETIEKAFERGFTTLKDGRGIGLTIVRKIIEAHGWRINVKSDIGKTRFNIIISRN